MKKTIALILVAIMTLFMFTACNNDEDNVPTRVPGNNLVSPDVNLNNNPDLNLNNSWSDNYYAMFTYYCPAQGYSTATVISERKQQIASSFQIRWMLLLNIM